MKRSQAALEFLMTYGWAILIVLIAIGALAYCGVLNPVRFMPRMCTFVPGISCDDFVVRADGTGALVLRNGFAKALTSVSLTMQSQPASCTSQSAYWVPGDLMVCSFTNLDTGNGESFSDVVMLNYSFFGSILQHSDVGQIITRIEGGAQGSSSSQTCQNAQDADLCEGLDIVYGSGYQAACCSSYGLCC